jgi:hypothetical protein
MKMMMEIRIKGKSKNSSSPGDPLISTSISKAITLWRTFLEMLKRKYKNLEEINYLMTITKVHFK